MQGATAKKPEETSAFDALAGLDACPPASQHPEIPGRFSPAEHHAPARIEARSLSAAARLELVARALPALEQGRTLRELGEELGVDHVTLRGWCIAYDEPAYKAALRSQVGARLAATVEELEECGRDAAEGVRMTKARELVQIGEGKQDSYQLIGPEVVKAARARASIAESAGKFWALMAERRLPAAFGKVDSKPPTGPARASFTFIVDGTRRHARGRLVGEGSTSGGALPLIEPAA